MMSRRLAVRITAWGLRRGISPADVSRALAGAYRHKESAWRWGVLSDAAERNQRRKVLRG